MQTFKIAHLYPDLMEVYSDRGNVRVLEQRMSWRGYEVQVDKLTVGDEAVLEDYDLVFSGGGEDRDQELVAADLLKRRDSVERALQAGTVFLTICGSYQLMGHYFQTIGGKRLEGLSLLDVHTIGGNVRLVGNAAGELQSKLAADSDRKTIVGYENHSGRTFLGPNAEPWLRVIHGYGNNGEDSFEGVKNGTLYGTYFHGPLLSKNPHLADGLLAQALLRHESQPQLAPLPDELEWAAHEDILKLMTSRKA